MTQKGKKREVYGDTCWSFVYEPHTERIGWLLEWWVRVIHLSPSPPYMVLKDKGAAVCLKRNSPAVMYMWRERNRNISAHQVNDARELLV